MHFMNHASRQTFFTAPNVNDLNNKKCISYADNPITSKMLVVEQQ